MCKVSRCNMEKYRRHNKCKIVCIQDILMSKNVESGMIHVHEITSMGFMLTCICTNISGKAWACLYFQFVNRANKAMKPHKYYLSFTRQTYLWLWWWIELPRFCCVKLWQYLYRWTEARQPPIRIALLSLATQLIEI